MSAIHRLNHSVYGGYVDEDEVEYCHACHRRVWVWELHHLVPTGWGGNPSRRVEDEYIVWVKLCGDCHGAAHRILDTFKPNLRWDHDWVERLGFPHYIVAVARWGWNLAYRQGHLAA